MLIQTDRCLIRPFAPEDMDAFMAYRNHAEWMRFQGFKGLTREAYEDALLVPIDENVGFQLAIVRKPDGALLGDLYLKRECNDCLIGYTIAPAYARQGYASEAVQSAISWALDQDYARMIAWIDPENMASIALVKHLGFVPMKNLDGDELGFAYSLRPNPSPS